MSNLSRTQLNELADIYSSMSSTESPEQLDEVSQRLHTMAKLERITRPAREQLSKLGPGIANVYQRGMKWVKTKAGADPNRNAYLQAGETLGRGLTKTTGAVLGQAKRTIKDLGKGGLEGAGATLNVFAPWIGRTAGALGTAGLAGYGGYQIFRKVTGADKQQLGDSYNMMEEMNSISEELLEERVSIGLYFMAADHLIHEGYATDLNSANVIIENMSEEWAQRILEQYVTCIEG